MDSTERVMVTLSGDDIDEILTSYEESSEEGALKFEDFVWFRIEHQIPPSMPDEQRIEFLGAVSTIIWCQCRPPMDELPGELRVFRKPGGSFSYRKID